MINEKKFNLLVIFNDKISSIITKILYHIFLYYISKISRNKKFFHCYEKINIIRIIFMKIYNNSHERN